MNKELFPMLMAVQLGSLGADVVIPAFCLNHRYKLKSAKLVNGGTLAADSITKFVLSLKKGTTLIASIDSEDDGIVANTSAALVIEDDQDVLAAGDYKLDYNESHDPGDPEADPVVPEASATALSNAKLILELVKL